MMTQSFLNSVAHFTDENIRKIVINEGELEIKAFAIKQVEDGDIVMNYMIPGGQVAIVNKIELRNVHEETVSYNKVHVPITADTLIVHTIHIKEDK